MAALAFAANAASWRRWQREPYVHDEFSYLLAADTYAHGRLTNPTHPMWRHFETLHVIHRPTYQSKYPPGQGLALAAGIVLFDQPIAGVWLSLAAACAALVWMLRGWMPWPWALAGGMMAALHPAIGSWWGQTYWGGAVAMCGGALVYGAVPRLLRRDSAWSSAGLGLGLAVLLLSRPVEGALAALPALVFLATRLWRKRARGRRVGWRTWAPALFIVAAASAWLGYYNWRVTGDAFRSPYWTWVLAYQSDAAALPADLRRYHGSIDLSGVDRFLRVCGFYFPLPLALVLGGLWWMRRSRWTRLHAAAALWLVTLSVAFTRGWPHYTAPVAGAVVVLLVQGFRGLWRAARSRLWLRVPVALVPLLTLLGWSAALAPQYWGNPHLLGRERVLKTLEGTPRDHLVIVRYGPGHAADRELVFNEADIDAAHVVWARELGGQDDIELLVYFHDRRIWLLEPDVEPPRFGPYRPLAATLPPS